VVDELLTLLKVRVAGAAAVEAGRWLWAEKFSEVVFLSGAEIREAWRIFQSHRDKKWSFTDCTSFALMRRHRITRAFAFDHHFAQMPGIRRLP